MGKIFAANWKANPETEKDATRIAGLFREIKNVRIIVFPPALFLSTVSHTLKKKKISLGIQNISVFETGSHTGEISARMAKSVSADFAIIGHSERRAMGEKNSDISAKIISAFSTGLTPLVCVGENKKDRTQGFSYAKKIVVRMLRESLKGTRSHSKNEIIVAYEPLWAIGAKKSATVSDAEEMILVIRAELIKIGFKNFKILYGGSVDEKNIKDFWLSSKIDGVLVGRASVDSRSIPRMLSALSRK